MNILILTYITDNLGQILNPKEGAGKLQAVRDRFCTSSQGPGAGYTRSGSWGLVLCPRVSMGFGEMEHERAWRPCWLQAKQSL